MISPARVKRICDAISAGKPDRVAAAKGGISSRCFYLWKVRGEKALEEYGDDELSIPLEELPYVQFFRAVEIADVEREETLHGYIEAFAPADWRAADRLLKYHYPTRYADRSAVKVDATVEGNPKKPVVAHLDVSRLGGTEALVDLLKQAGRKIPGEPDLSEDVGKLVDNSDKAGGE